MPKQQTRLLSSWTGLAAIILTSIVLSSIGVLGVAPWLHEEFFPQLEIGVQWHFATVLLLGYLLTFLLTIVFAKLGLIKSFDSQWLATSKSMPRETVVEEVREVTPFLDLMRKQLDGAIKETEQGVLALITSINSIHEVSGQQLDRIQSSKESGAELSLALKEKVMIDKELSHILEMVVSKQQQDAEANLGRIKRLQEVKSLGPLVDVISGVARQTNLLSVNAAIEAAHAGQSGRGFSVLAAEIRQMSLQTAEAAVSIAKQIKAATEGIDEELKGATKADEPQSATGNMHKVMSDIDEMQHRSSDASQRLLEIIDGVKQGHQDIVVRLSEALGQIQFQDVIRQRVEHVQGALEELNGHLQCLADQLAGLPWDPAVMVPLRQRLDDQVQSYVMQSQRSTHQDVTGQQSTEASERPNIELF